MVLFETLRNIWIFKKYFKNIPTKLENIVSEYSTFFHGNISHNCPFNTLTRGTIGQRGKRARLDLVSIQQCTERKTISDKYRAVHEPNATATHFIHVSRVRPFKLLYSRPFPCEKGAQIYTLRENLRLS